MARLRSHARRPALRVLPRDVLARCIEFLPFDQALELKQVSKEFRSAARRAITHRWRAIKFVATKALDMVLQDSVQLGAAVPAEALSTFRAAWDLDPGLVVREIAEWEDGSALTDDGFWAAVFLKLVEPRIDGLPRVVAACERTLRLSSRRTCLLAPTAPPSCTQFSCEQAARCSRSARSGSLAFGPINITSPWLSSRMLLMHS